MTEPAMRARLTPLLVVEDDELMQVFYERFFREHREEFVLHLRSNAGEALALLRHGGIRAAILDWDLPVISGLALLHAIRANPATRGLPVIIASGRSAPDCEALALARGANAYLAKPFEVVRLLDLLRRLAR